MEVSLLPKGKRNRFLQALAELYTNSDKLDTAILFYKRLLYTSVIENNEGIFAQALAQLVEIYKK